MLSRTGLMAVGVALAFPAAAADRLYIPGGAVAPEPAPLPLFDSPTVSLKGGVGYRTGRASELVYDTTSGQKISELTWDHEMAVLRGSVDLHLTDRFSVRAAGWTALSDENLMRDKDWLLPIDDWTDYSRHEDTRTDHAFSLDARLRYSTYQDSELSVGPVVGWRYSNLKWTAYGGDYTYSTFGFRDTIGSFTDGVPGITYEQWISVPYAGASAVYANEAWEIEGSLIGSLFVDIEDEDHHWLRNLRFVDVPDQGAFLAAQFDAAYRISRNFSVGGSIEYERYFEAKGRTDLFEIDSGDFLATAGGDAAGAAYEALTIGVFATLNL